VVDHRDEEDEEMPGTNILWSVIGEAMGVNEQLQRRQSARMRELFEQEEFESEEEEFEEDEDFMVEDCGGGRGVWASSCVVCLFWTLYNMYLLILNSKL
jgi:hypothetical protein